MAYRSCRRGLLRAVHKPVALKLSFPSAQSNFTKDLDCVDSYPHTASMYSSLLIAPHIDCADNAWLHNGKWCRRYPNIDAACTRSSNKVTQAASSSTHEHCIICATTKWGEAKSVRPVIRRISVILRV
eukprot:1583423-Pleurochrysis_carterae.AAC.1